MEMCYEDIISGVDMLYVLCREINGELYYFSEATDIGDDRGSSKIIWISSNSANKDSYFLINKKQGEYLLKLMLQDYGERGVFLREIDI